MSNIFHQRASNGGTTTKYPDENIFDRSCEEVCRGHKQNDKQVIFKKRNKDAQVIMIFTNQRKKNPVG